MRVRISGNFNRNLDQLRAFYGSKRSALFGRLLRDVEAKVIPNVERFPLIGRDFFARQAGSAQVEQAMDAMRLMAKELGYSLREYVLGDHIILYGCADEDVWLLAVRNHAQLGYDLRADMA